MWVTGWRWRGGDGGGVVAAVVASGGEWHSGSSRSCVGECFIARPEFWPEVVAGGGDGGRRLAGDGGSGTGKSRVCRYTLFLLLKLCEGGGYRATALGFYQKEQCESFVPRMKAIYGRYPKQVVVWRNKPDLDTMSFDDLYKNFKIIEQEVKGTASSSSNSSSSSQNLAFVSSSNSTNEVNTANRVSTASTQVSTASTQVSTANLSDATMYAFFASQPNGSQLAHKDLMQIHEDDLEEMDLKWQLALLNVEDTFSKAMVAFDEAGFDWSYMADDEVPTDMALMAFSDSENEVLFCEQIVVLKRDLSYRDSEISRLKCELEKLKKEKESTKLKLENFDHASQSLDKLIWSQIIDKSRKGLGFESYNVVPPSPTGLFSLPKIDLSYSGLEEFTQPEFKSLEPKSCKTKTKNASKDIPNKLKESPDAPLVNDRVSDDKDCLVKSSVVEEKKIVVLVISPNQHDKAVRKTVRLTANTIKGKGWPVNTAYPKTTVQSARPMSRFSNIAPSTIKRPIPKITALTNRSFYQKVNTAKEKVNTARLKAVNTARPKTVNTAKPSPAVVNVVRVQ
nr:hypothetical protein [Tanacetum cinerariifolium]